MARSKFNINYPQYRKFKSAIVESFAAVIETLNDEYDAVIEDLNEFADLGFVDWDIVDTGRLRDSKQLDVRTEANGDLNATWDWNPHDPETGYPYAAAVYSGFNAYGKRYIPGRPWPERAIKRVDIPKALSAEMKLRGVPAKVRKKVIG